MSTAKWTQRNGHGETELTFPVFIEAQPAVGYHRVLSCKHCRFEPKASFERHIENLQSARAAESSLIQDAMMPRIKFWPRPQWFLLCTLVVAVSASLWGPIHATAATPQENNAEKESEQAAELETDAFSQDVAAAFEKAKSEGKDVFMLFTGSDWCPPCIKLEEEVFSQTVFEEKAAIDFVLLKLDFPRDKSKLAEAVQKQNEEWSSKLSVSAFPTVMLLDADGLPYSVATGFQEGGPAAYLENLAKLREIRIRRDDALAQAEEAAGVEKAKLIDQALKDIDENLVSTHYADVIKEIIELDPDDESGLRTKYFAAQDAEARKRIMARINLVATTLPPNQAIGRIDSALEEMKLPIEMKMEALQVKFGLLKKMDAHAEATQLLDEMMAFEGLTPEGKNRIVEQKVYTMVEAGQSEAAVELLSELISTTIENLSLYVMKGELLDRLGKHEEAVAIYDEALTATSQRIDQSINIILLKSDALASADRYEDSIKLLTTWIGNKKTPRTLKLELLIQKTILLFEMGDEDAASKTEKEALNLVEDPVERQELRELFDDLRGAPV